MRKSLSSFVIGLSLLVGNVAQARIVTLPVDMPVAPPLSGSITRAQVHTALAARRAVTLARFLAYREARVYPKNPAAAGGPQHIWRDANGHLCAAATIISGDWGVDGSVRAANGDLHLKIANQHAGPLMDWILTSGLTKHELVAIQVPAMPQPRRPDREVTQQQTEIDRLYGIYIDVQRQLEGLADDSLDEATDALMARPELAARLVDGVLPAAPPPKAAASSQQRFAQPPRG